MSTFKRGPGLRVWLSSLPSIMPPYLYMGILVHSTSLIAVGKCWNAQTGNGSLTILVVACTLTLRSMLQSPVQHLNQSWLEFIRVPALLRRLPEDHPSRRLFEQFGMTPKRVPLELCHHSTDR